MDSRRRGLVGPLLLALPLCFSLGLAIGSSGDSGQSSTTPLSEEAVKALKNPVPYDRESIVRGRTLYQRYCTECHGVDGRSMVDVIANATDLTAPQLWKHGTTDGETFRSIRDGAGLSMPPYRFQIREEEDLWHLVNFIRSLWPESMRPPLQEGKPANPQP
jgi:mono/diheme cytochrome c family protein